MNTPTTPPPNTTPSSPTTPLSEILTHDYLMWASDDYAFESGHYVSTIRKLDITEQSPTHIEARVLDPLGKTHTVTIDSVDSPETGKTAAKATCTCPFGRNWCTHSIAVALRLFPDVDDPWEPWLDKDAIFERFLEEATRDELAEVLGAVRETLVPDDQDLIIPAVFSVGTPEEMGKMMSMTVRDLIAMTGVYCGKDNAPAGNDALASHYDNWELEIQNLALLHSTEQGSHLLPAIEKMVEALCVLAGRDESYVDLLKQVLNLHGTYCHTFTPDSGHLVSWLENTIEAVDAHIPGYNFSYYRQFVELLDLAAAINRAAEANNTVLHAYLSRMAFDDEPYCTLLAERSDWVLLANHYGFSGQLDKAREIIAQAQDPDSAVTIAPDELAELIRLSETAE